MCLVHSPSAPAAPPPPVYLHNPYLDGAAMGGLASNRGRNSMRTDLGNTGPAGMPTAPVMGGPASPNGGLALTPGMPSMSQPGTVVPSVGGVMAGVMAGAVTRATPAMARESNK
jgi:hypothetical protein